MTDTKKLTADDARALLSDHLEGALDEPTRLEVEALLASDAVLAAEHRRLRQTLEALHALPAPEAPSDMVAKVRGRLADERRAAMGGGDAGVAPVTMLKPAGSGWRRWGGIEAAIGLAAAASVAIFVAVAGGEGKAVSHDDGTHTAGVGGAEQLVTTTVVAPGFPRYVVYELAAKAGMDTVVGDTYEGDRRAAGRFMMALKETAAVRGVEISGFVPDAERVRIAVRAE